MHIDPPEQTSIFSYGKPPQNDAFMEENKELANIEQPFTLLSISGPNIRVSIVSNIAHISYSSAIYIYPATTWNMLYVSDGSYTHNFST